MRHVHLFFERLSAPHDIYIYIYMVFLLYLMLLMFMDLHITQMSVLYIIS